jgi:signal transduction histidine kinase
MVGLYTVTVMGTTRRALVASAVTLVALMAANAIGDPFGAFEGSSTVLPFEVASVLLFGLAVANRRVYAEAMRERFERAERTREEEARRRVDAERLRIARELHDVVAHTISVINVQARVAAQVIPDPPEEGAQALAAIKEASVQALREVRNILGLLRQNEAGGVESPGGLDRLDALVSATTKAGLPVTVTMAGEPYTLPPTVDLAAYRIVQESLTNALRHAGQAQATVHVSYLPGGMTIEVVDDGCGTGTGAGQGPHGLGYGIAGMRERAASVGGTVEAGPRDGGGFGVRASLPVPHTQLHPTTGSVK